MQKLSMIYIKIVFMSDTMDKLKQYYSDISVAREYNQDRFTSKAGKMFDSFEKDIVISNSPKGYKTR